MTLADILEKSRRCRVVVIIMHDGQTMMRSGRTDE